MNAKKPQSRELIAPEFKNPNRDVVGNREIDSQALSSSHKSRARTMIFVASFSSFW